MTRHGSGRSRWLLQERPAGPETTPLPTIAEIFSRNGWRTAAFVCNGQLSRANGFSRGFERYHELWKVRSGDYDLLRFFLQRVPGLLDQDKGGRLALRGLEDYGSPTMPRPPSRGWRSSTSWSHTTRTRCRCRGRRRWGWSSRPTRTPKPFTGT